MPGTPRLSIGTTLRAMRDRFESDGSTILKIAAVCALLNASVNLLDLTGAVGIAISVGIATLLVTASVGMITAIACLPVTPASIGEPFAVMRPALARLIWVTLVLGLIPVAISIPAFVESEAVAMLGLFLFPVAVVAVIFWSVSFPVALAEKKRIAGAFGRSAALVRGNAWRVLGFQVCVGVFSLTVLLLAALIASPIGNDLAQSMLTTFLYTFGAIPLVALGTAELYNQLRAIERERSG